MTKQKKDCLIGLLIFIILVALFTLLTLDEPFEIHERPRKPSYSEEYRKLMEEKVKKLEKKLQDPFLYLERMK